MSIQKIEVAIFHTGGLNPVRVAEGGVTFRRDCVEGVRIGVEGFMEVFELVGESKA